MIKTIARSTLDYLSRLDSNNNREWFKKHKAAYDQEREHFVSFCQALLQKIEVHDVIETMKVYRIYRDVRFSKDKTPYKDNFSCHFVRLGKLRRGGYYFEIKPGGSFVAGGFWKPNSADLLRIRRELEMDSEPLRKILAQRRFKEQFGELHGAELKTAPRGFDRQDPNLDLIRKKQFVVLRSIADEELLSDDFISNLDDAFRGMRPFLDYMTEVLTTDLNGELIV